MSINRNRREALPFLRRVLSNDYTCDPDDFLRDGVTINEFGTAARRTGLPAAGVSVSGGDVRQRHGDYVSR
ncbi:MAG: hypothetical protein R2845_16740 [Thermomicrobiales bacterium]